MPFSTGHNMPGYLPESMPSAHRTFDDAKSALISDLKFAEDYADSEDAAEDYSAAAEDVNLWSATDAEMSVTVGGESYWIQRISNADYFNVPTDDNDQPVKFAWPGGYEVFYICDDGGVLCADCLRDESNPAHADPDMRDGWQITAYDHCGNTDDAVSCDHCGRVICE